MESRIAALGTFMKLGRERDSVEKECSLSCFLFYELFSGKALKSSNPPPLLPLPVQPDDLNNETPMFCLSAVFLYIAVAQEECLDCQPLSHRTLLRGGAEMDFGSFSPPSFFFSTQPMSP